MFLNGDGITGADARGGTIVDDHFLLYFNADGEATVTLPPDEYADAWDVVIDTGGSADEADVRRPGRRSRSRTAAGGAPRAPPARGRARPLGRRVGRRKWPGPLTC